MLAALSLLGGLAASCSSKAPPSASTSPSVSGAASVASPEPSGQGADVTLRAAMQSTVARAAELDALRGEDGRAAVGRPGPTEVSKVPNGVRWPVVSLEGSVVRLDGAEVTSLGPMIERGRPGKVDELFVQLKTWRERWKEQHAPVSFPGVVGLRLPNGAPAVALKSLFQTAVYAGYPFVHLQSSSEPADVYLVVAQIPGPPSFDGAPRPTPPAVLQVAVTATQARLEWRKGDAPGAPLEVALEPQASLDQALCESWRREGAHREASDRQADLALLQSAPDAPFGALHGALRAVARCTRGEGGRQALWAAYAPR